jgi:hypothetical protein
MNRAQVSPRREDRIRRPISTQIAANRFRLQLFQQWSRDTFNAIIGAGEYPADESVERGPQLHESRV